MGVAIANHENSCGQSLHDDGLVDRMVRRRIGLAARRAAQNSIPKLSRIETNSAQFEFQLFRLHLQNFVSTESVDLAATTLTFVISINKK